MTLEATATTPGGGAFLETGAPLGATPPSGSWQPPDTCGSKFAVKTEEGCFGCGDGRGMSVRNSWKIRQGVGFVLDVWFSDGIL